jgi:alpha-N-arabinofuranosidase
MINFEVRYTVRFLMKSIRIHIIIPIFCFLFVTAESKQLSYTNPVISGSYPDPSICRVGDDYYIVNSSFEYFPGLPIHHSRDLVNWELIGYGLHRESQCNGKMNLVDVQSDGGIHAPSIRYHNGTYYIITTNVYSPGAGEKTEMINFVITSENIEGPWSEPHIIEGAPGIDPDIIFDDDGTVWYVGTHSPSEPNFDGEGEIWLQQLDLKTWSLTGERYYLWRGALFYGTWAEGPHIYKRNGYYYLVIAEGGTGLNHAVMISVSDNITGPYVPNDRNPILTSRHLTNDYWVNSVGHGDLVQTKNGNWYMVALGIRSEFETFSSMGRETHLIPVTWEQEKFPWKYSKIDKQWVSLPNKQRFEKLRLVNYEWPVCSPLTGKVEKQYPLPIRGRPQRKNYRFKDSFNKKQLGLEWNFRRVPKKGTYNINPKNGYLRLYSSKNVIKNRKSCSLMGIRQKQTNFTFLAKMRFNPNMYGIDAGVSLFQKDDNYLTFTVEYSEGEYFLKLILKEKDLSPNIVKRTPIKSYNGSVTFKIVSKKNSYDIYYTLGNKKSFTLFKKISPDKLLSKGYTGAYLGVYCTSNGKEAKEYADFDKVEYY